MTRQPTVPRTMVISTVVLAVLLLASSVWAESPPGVATIGYTVAGGDTLWSIATDVTEPGADVRIVISQIRHINDLDNSIIRPGDLLLIPTG